MNSIYSHLYLDLQHKTIDAINLKQYDYESRYINFHITNNGNPYQLMPDMQAEIKIHKPDGTKIINFANIDCENNYITTKITKQITVLYGILNADISLFQTEKLISTMPFLLNVEKSPVQNEDISSAHEYGVLEDLIIEVQKNEGQRQLNEADRNNAENIRIANENTRIENENVRKENEDARIQNENTRKNNEHIRMSNEEIRKDQEIRREEETSITIQNAQNATNSAIEATTDLQNKLNNHHFILSEDKDIPNGVPSLDNNRIIPIDELPTASTTSKGITQLTDSVTSNSTTTAATPNSVKTVYDIVVGINQQKHTHGNKSVLDGITADTVGKWNAAAERTDTWRGIQDNLTSTSAVDSLSANQGRVLKEMIDNKLSASVPWNKVTGKPSDYPPSAHNHDGRYYTEDEVNNLLAGKAASSHTHSRSQITDFPSSLPASDVYAWAKASSKPSYSWSEIGSKPGTFTPSSHSHDDRYYTEGEVNSLLAAKAASNHSHSFANITDKPALGQWVASCGATTLATGRNVPLSAYILLSGWFFVSCMIRFATNDDSINVGLYVSAGGNKEYSETWPGSQGARGVRSYTNLSTSRILWINAGAYINLSCHASKSCQLEGARIEYTLLCSY